MARQDYITNFKLNESLGGANTLVIKHLATRKQNLACLMWPELGSNPQRWRVNQSVKKFATVTTRPSKSRPVRTVFTNYWCIMHHFSSMAFMLYHRFAWSVIKWPKYSYLCTDNDVFLDSESRYVWHPSQQGLFVRVCTFISFKILKGVGTRCKYQIIHNVRIRYTRKIFFKIRPAYKFIGVISLYQSQFIYISWKFIRL